MTQQTETAYCKNMARIAIHGGVAVASTALGYAMMRLFVLPNAPDSDIWALTVRFIVYALLLAVVFRCSDAVMDYSPILFAPFSGLTAVSFTTASYLLIFGVPTSLFLAVVVFFRLGGALASCWGSASEKEMDMELGRQLVQFSRTLLVLTVLTFSGIFVANMLPAAVVSGSLF